MAFLDHPDLVRVAPVPPPRRVLGGQDLDLGCERKVDHKVGLIIASSALSDGSRRSVTPVPPVGSTYKLTETDERYPSSTMGIRSSMNWVPE